MPKRMNNLRIWEGFEFKGKSNFIEKGYQQIHLIEDLGSKIANKNDEEFISKVLKDTPTLEYGLIYDAVYDMIQKLKNTGFKPSVIFTDSIAAYDDSIEESSYFIPYWKYMDKRFKLIHQVILMKFL